ncbi:MAG TPA: hypothetical protein VN641_11155 [Urbifossiella sp.]|nr:hypothetical protein [Urbifossiella sp.]
MLSVNDYRTADLGPTATYGRRRLCWIPASREHPEWDRRDGNLTLVMQHARTGWGRKIETDTYAVEEQPPIIGVMGRVFLLLNLSDDEQDQPYQCVIGPNEQCTCTAAKCKVPASENSHGCKHIDALNYLVENGHLGGESETESGSWYDPDYGEMTQREMAML